MDPLAVGHYTIAMERAGKLMTEYLKVMAELAALVNAARSRGPHDYVHFEPHRSRLLLDQAAQLSGQVTETIAEANTYADAAEKPHIKLIKVG